ncbi:hydrolase [Clostridia bacterium]|nr:hydrolase [Clostridia bacterium]
MFGAIIGDIAGSVYEWHNIKTKYFPLFGERNFFTDDTVMTIATADALMNGGEADDFIDAYKKWGRQYPNAGYSGRFGSWLNNDSCEPYNSWGNGSAMRVSPCAEFAFRSFYSSGSPQASIDHAHELAKISANVTHNHTEGIKGAEAVAYAQMMCYCYGDTEIVKEHIREEISAIFGYDLSRTLDEIRPTYKFNESCQDTVPQAIIAFLESTDFEDAIRNAISLGGDSDTLSAITGGIAEAAYGIPQWIKDKAWTYLNEPLKEVCQRWQVYIKGN